MFFGGVFRGVGVLVWFTWLVHCINGRCVTLNTIVSIISIILLLLGWVGCCSFILLTIKYNTSCCLCLSNLWCEVMSGDVR